MKGLDEIYNYIKSNLKKIKDVKFSITRKNINDITVSIMASKIKIFKNDKIEYIRLNHWAQFNHCELSSHQNLTNDAIKLLNKIKKICFKYEKNRNNSYNYYLRINIGKYEKNFIQL